MAAAASLAPLSSRAALRATETGLQRADRRVAHRPLARLGAGPARPVQNPEHRLFRRAARGGLLAGASERPARPGERAMGRPHGSGLARQPRRPSAALAFG